MKITKSQLKKMIKEEFEAHAVIHFGKHGNLEWLPGRSVALGANDFPQIALKTLIKGLLNVYALNIPLLRMFSGYYPLVSILHKEGVN